MLATRQLDAAKAWFQWSESIDLGKGETQFLMARVERIRGNPVGMNAHLESALKAGFPAIRLHREQVLAYAQAGRIRQIEKEIPSLLMAPGDDGPAICEAIVSGYLQSFRLNEAMALIDAWRRDHPQDPQPLVVLGMYFAQRQVWSKAAEKFEQALRIRPARDDIRIQWAEALFHLHDLSKARNEFELVLKTSPRNSLALIGLGRCLLELGEPDAANERFRQVLQIEPESWGGRFWLGKLLSSDGKFDEALPLLRATALERPYEPDVRYTIAMTLKAAGKNDEANEHFQYVTGQQQAQAELRNMLETLERSPTRIDLRLQIGKTLLEFGNPAEGIGWLQSVLELVPDHPEARAAISEHMNRRNTSPTP